MLIIGLLLSACQSATTLILLPDESGKVGAITVKTADDFRVIDQKYGSVTTKAFSTNLAEVKALSKTEIDQDYAELINAQPKRAISFLVYFSSGSTKLLDKSIAILPEIVAQIKESAPTEISIIGHTDTKGSDAVNNKLAKQRALAVKKLLKEKMPSLSNVTVQSYGSKDLLIKTLPNVSEQRNRRVEILIP